MTPGRFAISFFNCQTARRRHASSPRVDVGHRASRLFLFHLLRESRAERLAKNRFRGRPLARRASRTPFEKLTAHGQWFSPTCEDVRAEPGPRTQFLTCVPHTDGFIGLLDVPGFGACAPSPRSCELSPGHALEPSAPSAGVCPVRLHGSQTLKDVRGPTTLRTSVSRSTPRRRPLRAPYRYGKRR